MFIGGAVRSLTCTGALLVLLGATTSSPSVTIADGTISPSIVSVAAGGSVLWTNRGSRQHAIVAVGNGFPAFSLAPEGTRSVPFGKPGKFPYLMDGTVQGTVFVVATGGGAGEGTKGDGQSPASSTSCLTINRYDVRVAVHRDSTPLNGKGQATVIDWNAGWVAPMYIDRCPGLGLPMLITARPAAMSGSRGYPLYMPGGQFDTTIDLTETGCHYTYTAHLPAVMAVAAIYDHTWQSFDFLGGEDFKTDKAASAADFEREKDTRVAACGAHLGAGRTAHYTPIGDAAMPLDGFNGMLIGDNQLHLTFKVPPNSPVDSPILDALVAGKGFNYDTGMQTYQDKAGYSTRVRATVSFSRLEN
jgi:hypothetical protein